MSAFEVERLGIASCVFLALFVIYFAGLVYILVRGHLYGRYRLLGIYSLVRIGGQVAGMIFSIDGTSQKSALIAYIVLTATGYYFIINASLLFVTNQQIKAFNHSMLLVPLHRGLNAKRLFRILMIPAMALIIVGAAKLTGMSTEQLSNPSSSDQSKIDSSKAMLIVGAAIFLAQSTAVSAIVLYNVAKHYRLRTGVMYCLLVMIPFISLRSVFGILSICLNQMNYLYIPNYFDSHRLNLLVTYDYCLNTTPEFIAAVLLLATYWVDNSITKDLSHNPESTQGTFKEEPEFHYDADSQEK